MIVFKFNYIWHVDKNKSVYLRKFLYDSFEIKEFLLLWHVNSLLGYATVDATRF
jgi:hypothetical protein